MTEPTPVIEQVAADPYRLIEKGDLRSITAALADPHLERKLRGHEDVVYKLLRVGGMVEHFAASLSGYFLNHHQMDSGHVAQGVAIASFFTRQADRHGLMQHGPESMALTRNIVLVATGNTPLQGHRANSRHAQLLCDAAAVSVIRQKRVEAEGAAPEDLHRLHADVEHLRELRLSHTPFGRDLLRSLSAAVTQGIVTTLHNHPDKRTALLPANGNARALAGKARLKHTFGAAHLARGPDLSQ